MEPTAGSAVDSIVAFPCLFCEAEECKEDESTAGNNPTTELERNSERRRRRPEYSRVLVYPREVVMRIGPTLPRSDAADRIGVDLVDSEGNSEEKFCHGESHETEVTTAGYSCIARDEFAELSMTC